MFRHSHFVNKKINQLDVTQTANQSPLISNDKLIQQSKNTNTTFDYIPQLIKESSTPNLEPLNNFNFNSTRKIIIFYTYSI